MTGEIYGWMRGLAFFFIFMTAVLNCLPDQKYRRYVRFFLGMRRPGGRSGRRAFSRNSCLRATRRRLKARSAAFWKSGESGRPPWK